MDDKAFASAQPAERSSPSVRQVWRNLINRQEFAVLLLLLIVGAFLTLWTDTFLTWINLSNLLRNFSWIAIVALGESMVIIIGGIDLSVGATMALAGLVATQGMELGLPVPWAVLLGLAMGVAMGFINGSMVARVRLPAFIVTLGTMSIARGIGFVLTGGWPVRDLPETFLMLGQNDLSLGTWSLPVPVLFMIGVALLVSLLMNGTVVGRYIYTMSGGERALLVSGVNTVQVKVLVYTLCGLLAAIGGLLLTARLGVAAPTAAMAYEIDIIAAAVIGGTSLFGGVGSPLGVLLGAAIMQMLRNGLVLLGFPAYLQTLVIGAMMLVAIWVDYWRRR